MRFHRKTLWIWWLSYMAVVLVCVFAMLALYRHTSDTVQQSLESASRERAQNFAQLMDGVMNEIQIAANSIQLDSHMSALSSTRAARKTPETIDHIRCLQQEMLKQINTREHVEAIFLWFPQSDMLLTNIANWRAQHCAFGIDDFGLTMEELRTLGESANHSQYVQLQPDNLLYLRRINDHDGYKLLGIQVSTDTVLPEDAGFLQTDILLLQLDQGTVVWHGDESRWPGLTAQVYESDTSVLSLYQRTDQPLAGVRQIYTTGGYEIAYLMPQHDMYSPLSALRIACGLCCLALMLLGAGMALLFVRLQYRPIRRVADLVLSRAQETAEENVFQVIEQQVNTYLQELDQKDDLLRAARKRDQQHVLSHLITGWGADDPSAWLEAQDIHLAAYHYVLVCSLDSAALPQEEVSVSIRAALGTLQQQLRGLGLLYTLYFPRETMFLLDAGQTALNQLQETLRTFTETAQTTLQLSTAIGISRPQPGVPGLQLAAREAETALYAAVQQRQPVLAFDSIQQNANVDRMFFNRLSAIYDLTQNGNYQSALDLAEELAQQPGFGTLQAIALAINSAAKSVRLETPEQEAALRQILELPAALSRPEDLQEYAGRVFGQLAVSTAPAHSGQEAEVLEYLQKNYTDPQLSVAEMARQLSLSQSTLSRITMRTVGLTPLDYIQHLRMERAKELLQRGASVSEAAEQVGCTNTAALRRIFKKFENTTPANYAT